MHAHGVLVALALILAPLGAEMAVADLNATGGVLGQSVELIIGDDFCDAGSAGGAGSQTGERRRGLRCGPSLLALLDLGHKGPRRSRDPHDFPGFGQCETDRRKRP